jgi:hypothetical protein
VHPANNAPTTALPQWQADRLAVLLDALDGMPISDAERRTLTWLAGFERHTVGERRGADHPRPADPVAGKCPILTTTAGTLVIGTGGWWRFADRPAARTVRQVTTITVTRPQINRSHGPSPLYLV